MNALTLWQSTRTFCNANFVLCPWRYGGFGGSCLTTRNATSQRLRGWAKAPRGGPSRLISTKALASHACVSRPFCLCLLSVCLRRGCCCHFRIATGARFCGVAGICHPFFFQRRIHWLLCTWGPRFNRAAGAPRLSFRPRSAGKWSCLVVVAPRCGAHRQTFVFEFVINNYNITAGHHDCGMARVEEKASQRTHTLSSSSSLS